MKKVQIYSDGACSGNPGPGGWGALLRCGENEKELSGGLDNTTNNQMELEAAIQALRALKEPCEVDFYTDSKYVSQGISTWIKGWKKNGWKTASKKPVANKEQWIELDELASKHTINWHWLKGHAGHPENERCDELAREAVQRQRE